MIKPFEIKSYEVLDKLPDPFLFEDGTKVKTAEDFEKRKKEMYKYCVDLQYGTQPPKPEFLEVMTLYKGAKISSYRITSGTKKHPTSFTMKIFHPENVEGKLPAVVDGDLCFAYAFDKDYLSAVTDNNMLFVLFDRTEIVPDDGDCERNMPIHKAYPDCTFGAIGAWAWGYSRCVDALEKLGIVDIGCIAFTGHSRGGKTAMLAGILDERAAIVNPNETCAGACGCYRLHVSAIAENGWDCGSEKLSDLIKNYGFWMGPELKNYTECEEKLPFDAHFTKAMVAPRVLLVSEAASDLWANPIGSWQTTMAAKEVYKFLGAEEKLLWYFRDGYHYHKVEDIKMLVNAIQNYRFGTPLDENFFRRPFEEKELIFDWRSENG